MQIGVSYSSNKVVIQLAIQSSKEGPIDYILAGLAGAAGGIEKGLATRQSRMEREAAAKAAADFRKQELSLRQQGIDISRIGQELLQANQDAVINQRIADREASMSESELDRATRVQVAEIGAGKRQLTPQEINKAILENRKLTKEIEHAEDKNRRENAAAAISERTADLEDSRFELAKSGETHGRNLANAKYRLDIIKAAGVESAGLIDNQTKLAIANMDHIEREIQRGENFTDVERMVFGKGYDDLNEALINPTKENVERAQLSVKQMNTILKKAPHLQPFPTMDFHQKGNFAKVVDKFDVFNVLPGSGSSGDLNIVPPEGEPPAARQAQPPNPITQLLEQSKQAPTSPIQQLLKQEVALPPAPAQAPAAIGIESLSDVGQSIAEDLIAEGKTEMSPELKKGLLDAGMPKADIAKIEESIKPSKSKARSIAPDLGFVSAELPTLQKGLAGVAPDRKGLAEVFSENPILKKVIKALPPPDKLKVIISNNLFAPLGEAQDEPGVPMIQVQGVIEDMISMELESVPKEWVDDLMKQGFTQEQIDIINTQVKPKSQKAVTEDRELSSITDSTDLASVAWLLNGRGQNRVSKNDRAVLLKAGWTQGEIDEIERILISQWAQ